MENIVDLPPKLVETTLIDRLTNIVKHDLNQASEQAPSKLAAGEWLYIHHPSVEEYLNPPQYPNPNTQATLDALNSDQTLAANFHLLRRYLVVGLMAQTLHSQDPIDYGKVDLNDNATNFLKALIFGIHENTEHQLLDQKTGKHIRPKDIVSKTLAVLGLSKNVNYHRRDLIQKILENEIFWALDWTTLAHPSNK